MNSTSAHEDPLKSYSLPQTAKLLGKGQDSVKTLMGIGSESAFTTHYDEWDGPVDS